VVACRQLMVLICATFLPNERAPFQQYHLAAVMMNQLKKGVLILLHDILLQSFDGVG